MNQELKNLCKWVIDLTEKNGAKECKTTIYKARNVNIRYRKQKPEIIKEATTQGLSLEIFVDGKYSSQSTPDIRKKTMENFILKAIENTRYLEEDPFRTLPDPHYYEGRSEIDLQIMDPAYQGFSADQRHDLVKNIEQLCIEKGGNKLISTQAEFSDQYTELYTLSNNGFEGEAEGTRFGAEVSLTIQDEGDRKPEGFLYVSSRLLDDFPGPEEIAEMVSRDAYQQLGSKKIKTEKLPVIIQNRNAGRILSGLLSAMNGQNLQQKSTFLLNKKDKLIGNKQLTIIDNPLVIRGLGSRLFDSDGFSCIERTMIDEGILRDYYINWYYSRKLECEPTTGGSTNLIIPAGNRSVEEIMKDLGRGILITGVIGGNSNSTTGDFSLGIFGQLFDHGNIVQPLAEMNIADNHLLFWNKLIEIGNDPWKYSSWQLPSLVFKDIVVSGA
jgi:PmbA protein